MGKNKIINAGISLLFGLVTVVAFQNCGYAGPSEPERFMSSKSVYSDPPAYSELYKNVFQVKCLTCHSSGAVNFSSYDSLMAGGSVLPLNPVGSKLHIQVVSGFMPKGSSPLSAGDLAAIYSWIAAGATSDSAPSPIPNAPTALANMAVSPTSILLAWTLPSQTVTGTRVERGLSPAGPFTVVANLPTAVSSFSDSSLAPSTTYFYRVLVSNFSGSSVFSDVISITTPGYAPSAPTTLAAIAVSSSQINLTWVDNSADETGFVVERSASATGAYAVIATLGANAISYSDNGRTASTTYFYRVQATNLGGNSPNSNGVSVTTPAAIVAAPAAPSGLVAVSASESQINLTWLDNSITESGFKIERAPSVTGPFVLIFTTVANASAYSDSALASSTTYYYRISGYNAIGNSAYSAVVNAMTQAPASVLPAAPSGLVANSTSTSQINLTWADNSNNESGFKIERSLNGTGPSILIFTTAAGSTNYVDTSLTSATTYQYRIYSYNNVGNSAVTAGVSATTLAGVPAAPTTLAATAISSSQINLTWTDNSTSETGFKVEQASAAAGPFTVVATLGPNIGSYSVTALSPVSTSYYRVYAYNTGGNSGFTTTSSATTFGTFAWINTNIVQSKCLSCHSSVGASGGYNMATYTGVKTRVVPNNSAGSLFYQRTLDGSMPDGGTRLTTIQLNAIKTWIDSGALNN